MQTDKPPPIRVGVNGFNAFEAKPEPLQSVNWSEIAALPPFQMYAIERFGRTGRDAHEWATERAIIEAARVGDKTLMDAYCEWHKAKGYWPNESPFGTLL